MNIRKPTSILLLLLTFWFLWEIANHLPTNVLSYDVYGAYLHLPANFIYDDPFLTDWTWIESMNEKYNSTPSFYQFWSSDTGRQVIKYPLGFAVIYAPFFFVGHWLAPIFGFDQDGFSAPYHWSIIAGHCFYVLLGLWMARKVLLLFFSERMAAMLLFILFAGTNFFFTTTASLAMPHGHLFLFYGLLLWFTVRWYQNPSWKYSIFLGSTIGLAALIRATEILMVVIPLLWQVSNKETLLAKLKFLKKEKSKVLLIVVVILLFALIQLIYYKLATGKFFVDAYNNAGEGFDFASPYTWQFLFSARKGWLVYTPVLTLSFVGFWLMYKQKKFAFYSLLVFAMLNLYVLSSWTCWWYAESFGQRSLVQSYLVFLIPLGYLLQHILKQKLWVKFVFLGVILLSVALNQFQTWQMHHGILHPSRMTPDAYWQHFLASSRSDNFDDLLLHDKSISAEEFLENSSNLHLAKTLTFKFNGKKWIQSQNETAQNFIGAETNDNEIFSKDLIVAYPELTKRKNVIFQLEAWVYCDGDPAEILPRVVFKMRHKGKPYYDHYIAVEKVSDITPFSWSKVNLTFYSADVRNMTNDEIQIFAWQTGHGKFKLDGVKIRVFEGLRQ